MNMYQKIEVEKVNYTPRDVFLEDRSIYILKCRLIVKDNSYLFISEAPIKINNIVQIIENGIRNIKSKPSLDLNSIDAMVDQIKVQKGQNIDFTKLDNKYIIPGSSLKGAIRSRIEYKFKVNNGKIKSCYRVEGDFFQSKASNHIKFWGGDVTRSRGIPCDASRDDKVCITCDMFGAPSLTSLISIDDAYLEKGSSVRLPQLGNIEVIEPNSKFSTTIICRNFDYTRLGLLFLGMEIFSASPILLGMYKYRFNPVIGKTYFNNRYVFGWIRFELDELIECKKEKNEIKMKRLDKYDNDIKRIVDETKKILEEKFGKDIDWDKGVIKHGQDI